MSSPAPDEPTEAEIQPIQRIQNWHVSTSESHSLLRAHVAAEVAKATAELQCDKERLDWLEGHRLEADIEASADDGYRHDTFRTAIDAARAQQKDTP